MSTRILLFVSLFASIAASAKNLDAYVAPVVTGTIPFYKYESQDPFPAAKALPRFGFRFESGLINDNISLDLRASTIGYSEFAAVFRYFYCFNKGGAMLWCNGLGVGGSFSPGFLSDTSNRQFFDLLLNPYLRIIFDTREDLAFFVEGGADVVPVRNFSAGTPASSYSKDSRAKIRAEVAVGVMMNYETIRSSLGFGGAVNTGLEENAFHFGVRGGIANASLGSGSSRASVISGLALKYSLSTFGVDLDLLYANRRFGTVSSGRGVVDRLEVPMILYYRTPTATYFKAGAGGSFAMPLGNATLVDVGSGSSYTSSAVTIKPDFGGIVSVGMGSQSPIVGIELDLRFGFGLSNAYSTYKFKTWDLVAGFLF